MSTTAPQPENTPVTSFAGAQWTIYRDGDRCSAEFFSPEQRDVRLGIHQTAGQAAILQLDFPQLGYRGKLPEETTLSFHRYTAAQKMTNDKPTLVLRDTEWEHSNKRSKAELGGQKGAVYPLASDIRITDHRRRLIGHANVPWLEDAARWVGYCASWSARHEAGSGKPVVTPPNVKPPSASRAPNYPSRALSEDRRGATVVRATIAANGRVSACDIVQSSQFMDLDLAACQSISMLDFEPAKDADGKPTVSAATRRMVWAIE